MIFIYAYKIVTERNQIVSGTIRAYLSYDARRKLTKDGSTILFLANETEWLKKLNISFGFSPMERIVLFRNLAMMIDSGLTLFVSLDVLENQVRGAGIKRALSIIKEGMLNGKPLSVMLAKFPKYFSSYIVETVKVGEVGGTLSRTLERIAEELEENYELRRKVISALTYPLIILAVMFAVLMILSTIVLPKIVELFRELDATLPILTQIVLSISSFIANNPLFFSVIVISIPLGIGLFSKFEPGRHIVHRFILKVPFFGTLLKEYNLAQFFRSLATLQKSGISLKHSVEVAAKTLQNVIYQDAMNSFDKLLILGAPLSDGMTLYPNLFPRQVFQVVKIGEQTGRLLDSFTKLSEYYTRAVSHKTRMITSAIEPFMIILAGVFIGIIAISIFLPLYQVSEII